MTKQTNVEDIAEEVNDVLQTLNKLTKDDIKDLFGDGNDDGDII